MERRLSIIAALLLLPACNPPPQPVANPGTNQTVAVRQLVQLDGTGSMTKVTDPGAAITRWAWAFTQVPTGSTAALNHNDIAKPSFTPDLVGDYTLRLTVYDANGSASATVTVTAAGCVPMLAPIVATPAAPNVGDDVTLATMVTKGPGCDDRSPFTYLWSIVSVPGNSMAKLLPNAAAPSPTVHVDVAGDYKFSVKVTDQAGRSLDAAITVTAGNCGHNAPSVTAITAAPASPNTGDKVQLSATVYDADTDPAGTCKLTQSISYAWLLLTTPTGSHAALDSTTATNPWFQPDLNGAYVVRLVVTDSTGLSSASSDFVISAADCGSKVPVAQIGILSPFAVAAPTAAPPTVSVQAPLGVPLQLDASTSFDPDNAAGCGLNQTLTYEWTFEFLPPGSQASFNNPQAVNPSITPDVPGPYIIDLIVTDNTGRSSTIGSVQVNGFDSTPTVAAGVGPYTSLALQGANQDPRIGFYDQNRDQSFIATCTGASCAFSPVWSINTLDVNLGRMISIAAGNDALYATYWDTDNCQPAYAVSGDGGKTWQISTLQANPSGQGCFVDNQGFGCGNGNRNQIDYRDNGAFPVVAVSPTTGNPVVAFSGYVLGQQLPTCNGQNYTTAGYNEVRYAVCTGGCKTANPVWSITSMATGNAANNSRVGYTSIAYNPATRLPSVAFRTNDFDGNRTSAVGFVSCTAGCDTATPTFSTVTWVDTDRGFDNFSPNNVGAEASTNSLAISSTGQPSIAFRDSAKNWLRFTTCQGACTNASSWNGIVVDAEANVGGYASLALSPLAATLDAPRIAYLNSTTNTLEYALNSPSGWKIYPLDHSAGYISLKLSATDGPRVSHFYQNAVHYFSSGN
jgi:hypothetical protein